LLIKFYPNINFCQQFYCKQTTENRKTQPESCVKNNYLSRLLSYFNSTFAPAASNPAPNLFTRLVEIRLNFVLSHCPAVVEFHYRAWAAKTELRLTPYLI